MTENQISMVLGAVLVLVGIGVGSVVMWIGSAFGKVDVNFPNVDKNSGNNGIRKGV